MDCKDNVKRDYTRSSRIKGEYSVRASKSDWKYNGFYKKWELYLFRLFKLANYVESSLRLHKLNAANLDDILTPEGYEDNLVVIPPNPFLMGNDDEIFFMYYEDLIDLNFVDSDKGNRKLLEEIWKRISEIKTFLGITKGTRYVGEEREEWRLINEINWYIEYSEYASMMYRVILGDVEKEEKMLLKFKNFLRDRSRIRGTKSLRYY